MSPLRATLAVVVLTTVLPAIARAQPGSGAPYGSRDARPCTMPAVRGAPTATQAAQAVVCGWEGIKSGSNGQYLHLLDQVRVEVGRGKRYEPGQYTVGTDLDPTAPVYPIRGSQITYSCYRRASSEHPDRNCTAVDETTATGICYTTSFGQLSCSMTNSPPVSIREWRYDVAPPR